MKSYSSNKLSYSCCLESLLFPILKLTILWQPVYIRMTKQIAVFCTKEALIGEAIAGYSSHKGSVD